MSGIEPTTPLTIWHLITALGGYTVLSYVFLVKFWWKKSVSEPIEEQKLKTESQDKAIAELDSKIVSENKNNMKETKMGIEKLKDTLNEKIIHNKNNSSQKIIDLRQHFEKRLDTESALTKEHFKDIEHRFKIQEEEDRALTRELSGLTSQVTVLTAIMERVESAVKTLSKPNSPQPPQP